MALFLLSRRTRFLLIRVPRLVFFHQHRGAYVVLIALFANYVDQIRARQPELTRLAELYELLEVDAGHECFLLGSGKLQATHSAARL